MGTDFNLPPEKEILDLEKKILDFWLQNDIFERSISERPKDDLYVFYDGPPFISGLPHYGHLLGSVAKDLIPRYWTMKGKRVERVWGWDAHGLTVENQVQKKLGISNRKDIENYGLEKFIKACYEYTSQVSSEWRWYIDRIGRWVDMENSYKTTDQTYMESVIWAFKRLYEHDLIYQGVRTSLFCVTCGTPVSNFEIAMDNSYREKEERAIVVKFPIKSEGEFLGVRALAWTTTPWTIPSNRALVVDPKEKYSLVLEKNEEYIIASKRVDQVFEGRDFKIKREVLGKDLIGLSYEPPFDIYESGPNDFKIYSYEGMVNMEEGTGIVHSAPGFGDIDTEMGEEYTLNIMLTLDDSGKFADEVSVDQNPYKGLFYADANDRIRKDLKDKGLLFSDTEFSHRVPYHDRCDTDLIHRAQESWFIDIQTLKGSMLKHAEEINWVPSHIKEGRFSHVLRTSPDWCISRSRFWATPMPVWQSEDGDIIVVGSIPELEELSGQTVSDLHRPYIDEITIEKDGKVYHRIPEVMDSWFEAGSMPFAQFHYPFENKEKFDNNFPGDYVVEYIAQVRAWFNVMHRLSVALFDSHPFKNVICTGVMSGNDGRKMSKTFQNYADPGEVLKVYGGDALRLWLMGSPLMVGENANFDEDEIRTKKRNVLNLLWNSLRYFVLYANKFEFSEKEGVAYEHPLDVWINVRLEQTVRDISANIEAYTIPPAVEALETLIDDLSRWYIRCSRERIFQGDEIALNALYKVLSKIALISAPIIPFISDNIYRTLRFKDDPESVHLGLYPDPDHAYIKKHVDIVDKMSSDRILTSIVHSLRNRADIPTRQPLNAVYTKGEVHFREILESELNVKNIFKISPDRKPENKDIIWDESGSVALDVKITPELELEGQKRKIIRNLQKERKKAGLSLSTEIIAKVKNTPLNEATVSKYKEEIMEAVEAIELDLGSEYAVKKV